MSSRKSDRIQGNTQPLPDASQKAKPRPRPVGRRSDAAKEVSQPAQPAPKDNTINISDDEGAAQLLLGIAQGVETTAPGLALAMDASKSDEQEEEEEDSGEKDDASHEEDQESEGAEEVTVVEPVSIHFKVTVRGSLESLHLSRATSWYDFREDVAEKMGIAVDKLDLSYKLSIHKEIHGLRVEQHFEEMMGYVDEYHKDKSKTRSTAPFSITLKDDRSTAEKNKSKKEWQEAESRRTKLAQQKQIVSSARTAQSKTLLSQLEAEIQTNPKLCMFRGTPNVDASQLFEEPSIEEAPGKGKKDKHLVTAIDEGAAAKLKALLNHPDCSSKPLCLHKNGKCYKISNLNFSMWVEAINQSDKPVDWNNLSAPKELNISVTKPVHGTSGPHGQVVAAALPEQFAPPLHAQPAPPHHAQPTPVLYPQPGYIQPGYVQPGYVPPGYVQPGYVPPGYVQSGLPQPGYMPYGYPMQPPPPQPAYPLYRYGPGSQHSGDFAPPPYPPPPKIPRNPARVPERETSRERNEAAEIADIRNTARSQPTMFPLVSEWLVELGDGYSIYKQALASLGFERISDLADPTFAGMLEPQALLKAYPDVGNPLMAMKLVSFAKDDVKKIMEDEKVKRARSDSTADMGGVDKRVRHE